LCKYTLGVLLVVLAGYLIADRNARRHLRRPGPYLAGLLALTLLAPHVVWMARHGFCTLHYAMERSAAGGWFGHLKHPAAFLVGQLLMLLPVLVVLIPVLGRVRGQQQSSEGVSPRLARAVLHWAVLGPVALLLALSLTTGCQLRDIWGSPLWTFVGVWVLAVAGPPSSVRLRWSAGAWAVVAAGMLTFCTVKNVAWPYLSGRPTRVTYPGRALTAEVARRWRARCAKPFPIVAGEAWRASNVCCYAPHHPIIYSSGWMGHFVFEPKHVFWTNDDDLTARGGVLLWDAYSLGDALPAPARARFPFAEGQPPIVLPYQTGAAIRPDRVGVAFVWPRSVTGRGPRAQNARNP
jgi:hypothetical protein